MADFDYAGAPEMARGDAVQRMINLSGGLVSLALIAGMAVWGYQLLVRDVTGVPVIEALEGSYRVQPADPGGERAAYQGLAVNEIAAVGTAGGPVDQVTLAPPAYTMTEDDIPMTQLARLYAARLRVEAEATDVADGAPFEALAEVDPMAAEAIVLAQPIIVDRPDDALATDMAVAEALAGIDLEADIAPPADLADAPGMTRSPRPQSRPAFRVASATGEVIAPIPAAIVRPDPADLPEIAASELAAGTRLVQLGAFASPEIAREQWGQIGGRFVEYFDGKRRVIQQVETGGKTFYRLRAEGFADLADTRRFCAALLARSADCIPVELK